jgi:hypothetical protein
LTAGFFTISAAATPSRSASLACLLPCAPAAAGLTTDEGPDIAVNAHASDPHYGPSADRPTPIKEGDLLLLDVWAKRNIPGSVYYDITWVGYLGTKPPEKIAKIFRTVRDARDKAVDLILTDIARGQPATTSALLFTAMAPTWTASKLTTSAT